MVGATEYTAGHWAVNLGPVQAVALVTQVRVTGHHPHNATELHVSQLVFVVQAVGKVRRLMAVCQ